jgi:hypothetical protein
MKKLILIAASLLTLYPSSNLAQNSPMTAERKTVLLDVVLIDLMNQTADDLEPALKDRVRFNRTVADGKIKLVSRVHLRCLTGEPNSLRIGQRIPVQPASKSQWQVESVGLTLNLTASLTTDRLIELKYSLEWSATIPNYQEAEPAHIQRQVSGISNLIPNQLTPTVDLIQREPLWKSASPPGQEKANESSGNFLLLFSGRVGD